MGCEKGGDRGPVFAGRDAVPARGGPQDADGRLAGAQEPGHFGRDLQFGLGLGALFGEEAREGLGEQVDEAALEAPHVHRDGRVVREGVRAVADRAVRAPRQREALFDRREQAVRAAISDYLVSEIGTHYRQGELCIPSLMIVSEDEADSSNVRVWGDYWVYWYNVSGDTLKTVSGGSHPGLITLSDDSGHFKVNSFDQVADGSGFQPSASRIFGEHFDMFQEMNSNQEVREAVRQEQLRYYIHQNGLDVNYYQDYGWPAVKL